MLKNTLILSTVCASWLMAEANLATIDVNATDTTEIIKDIHGEDVKSADLSEALFKQTPSISIVRRSGIANDIILRGMKKDNLNITIDGMKLYGACPNRMDPPVSHVLTNNIDYITIDEGPFSVEDFGVLSADVKIHTIAPESGLHGDINLGFGSWDYQKSSFTLSGGNETIKFLLSASRESSAQYEDGNGDDFYEQIQREIDAGKVSSGVQYQDRYKDLDAYTKETLMAKLFWNITDNQELRLSYTANRSDDVLYPSSKMDAIYDDSDLYNMEYIAKELSPYSKELYVQLYKTKVEHPMSTVYRNMALSMGESTHALTSEVDGARIKNRFDIQNHTITMGADYTLRNWDGYYYKNGKPLDEASGGAKPFHSIYDVDTKNYGVYLSDNIKLNVFEIDAGLRYDTTDVDSGYDYQQSNSYDELTGFLTGTYHINSDVKVYLGYGRGSRVPDAKELYWVGSRGNEIGTPNLKNTINDEFDLGAKVQYDNLSINFKAYYSMLTDFIAYNATKSANMYENVDATVYGLSISGSYFVTDSLYFDYGLSYQKGKKDDPLSGESGTNMPEITPLKLNLAANYDWDDSLSLRAEFIASDRWSDYDEENGEQEIAGYGIINLKATKTFANGFEWIVGIDNLLDKAYAISNTYKDLILLPTTSPDDNIMLMNEPGRYIYTNLRYKF